MTTGKLFLLATCAALATAGGNLAAQTVRDTLVKKTGERLRNIEIVDLGVDTIRYQRSGTDFSLPSTELAMVEWKEPPEQMELARAALERGDYEAAANFFQEAAGVAKDAGRASLHLDCLFLAGRALVQGMGSDGSKSEAAKSALNAYLEAAPAGLRVPEARLLLGRATQVGGDTAAAAAIFQSIEDAAQQQNWGLIWDARAKFEKARALSLQGKHDEARAAYRATQGVVDAALGSAVGPDLEELRQLKTSALVGEGESLIAEGKIADAQRYFAGLTDSRADDGFRAAALAGEAQAMFLLAEPKADVGTLRQAQIKLAEASLLDRGSGPTTAKCYYLLGRILTKIGPENESSDYKARADDYFQTVLKHYGDSRWAAEARLELQR